MATSGRPASAPYFAPQPLPTPDGAPAGRCCRRSRIRRRDRLDQEPVGGRRAACRTGCRVAAVAADRGCCAAAAIAAGTGPGSQQLPPQFRRQIVNFPTPEPAGTIIVDTPNTYLYLVLGHGKALRYGIGVGRDGFTWSGTERISRMKEWPDWFPPKEMIDRQPYLPRFMAGGETNPLGARAMYLGNTLYRIHGTNDPTTIGKYHFVRLHQADQRGRRGSLQPGRRRHACRGVAGYHADRVIRRSAGSAIFGAPAIFGSPAIFGGPADPAGPDNALDDWQAG